MAALALYLTQSDEEGSGIVQELGDSIGSYLDNFTTDEMTALQAPNVQAFLRMIRAGEGTAGANGYRTLFGGQLFSGYDDHPRITVTAGGYTSTAAGAYQILSRTWDGLGLADFSPASQDLAAVMLIRRRGALADVLAGRIERAILKCAKEWASLPGSTYGQPTISLSRALSVYAQAGGSLEQLA